MLFWDLSVGEVVDVINAKSKAEKERIKQEIVMKQVQAIQIREHISILFDKDLAERLTPIWTFFPSLFEREKESNEEMSKENDLEEFKNRRRVFANNHNRKVGGDDD